VRGPLDDVLTRYALAAKAHPADAYVRLTADCPLLDPALIDACVTRLLADPTLDLVSNAIERTYPRGLDVEVFTGKALAKADAEADGYHRVHVTTWITDHPERFEVAGIGDAHDDSDLRITVDTAEDLAVVSALVAALGEGPLAASGQIAWLRAHPEITALNAEVQQKPDMLG